MAIDYEEVVAILRSIRQETSANKELMQKLVHALVHQAETEVPEFMRRFANYMHDLHDIRYMYEELGQAVPRHLLYEMERCDDRFRQLLEKLHKDGGAFEKVRREMAADPTNRWDHTRFLPKQGE
jgi:citrate synthase